MAIYIEDNQKDKYNSLYDVDKINKLFKYGNTSIKDLQQKYKDIIVYTNDDKFNKKYSDQNVFDYMLHIGDSNKAVITTNNIVGFILVDNQRLIIHSRFDKNNSSISKNYFLQYLIEQNEEINLINLDFNNNYDSTFDYLYLLFPKYLKDAFEQGLYKEYVRNSYNKSDLKGTIDFSDYIKNNIPNNGKISYIVREYTSKNKLFYLLRWTIEFMRKKELGRRILNSPSIKLYIMEIENLTHDYSVYNIKNVISQNTRKRAFHPFYHKYNELQDLCLKILNRQNFIYGEGAGRVYGCLFDISSLWEGYINKVLLKHNMNYVHPDNIRRKDSIHLFENRRDENYPDFYNKNKHTIIDAKYKFMDRDNKDDYNQMIVYMYILKYKNSILLYPQSEKTEIISNELNRNSYGGFIYKQSMNIPSSEKYNNYDDYTKRMEEYEKELVNNIRYIENSIVN